MTESVIQARRVKKPSWLLIAAVTLAVFFFTISFLSWRVRTGNDPVLSKQASIKAPGKSNAAKRILVIRRVIVTEVPDAGGRPAGGGGAQSAVVPAVKTSPAPAPAPAPASAAAPAPAPVPAPVTAAS